MKFRTKGIPGFDNPTYVVEVNTGPRTRYVEVGKLQQVERKWFVDGYDKPFKRKKDCVTLLQGKHRVWLATADTDRLDREDREAELETATHTPTPWPQKAQWPCGTLLKHKNGYVGGVEQCYRGQSGRLRYSFRIQQGNAVIAGYARDFEIVTPNE